MRKTSLFKQYILDKEILIAPVVHDPLCAKIAESIGFKAILSAGYANSAAYLGVPDISLLTLTEMVDCAKRIVDSVNIPVFADGDTGHGGLNNVARTVREFEKVGVAALFIEDQVAPKRCGHMTGKDVISPNDMVIKIKAATDARKDPDFVISARTDAIAVNGLDDAINRANLYSEAGADLIFIEAPESIEQMKRIAAEVSVPLMANNLDGGKTPILTAHELEEIGYAMVTNPVATTYAIAKSVTEVLKEFKNSGTTKNFQDKMILFDEFNQIVGLDNYRDFEKKISV